MSLLENRKFKVAAVAAIVVLPIFAVWFWSKAKWVHKELPYFGQTVVNPDGTKEYHEVGDIVLYNQHGKKIS